MLHLVGQYAISHDFHFGILGWESDDVRRIAGDLVLAIAYGGSSSS
jgi:hypothetical protein